MDAAGLSFFALTYARLFTVSPETSHSAWLRNTRGVQLASAPLTGLTRGRACLAEPASEGDHGWARNATAQSADRDE